MKLLLAGILLLSLGALAKVNVEKVEYKDGDAILAGAVVYDTSLVKGNKKLPGVVIVHDWMGVGDYVMMRADQLAKLGYVAFVADIYGKGNNPKDSKEAGALAGKYKSGGRQDMRSRATAAYNQLKSNKHVNSEKIMPIRLRYNFEYGMIGQWSNRKYLPKS